MVFQRRYDYPLSGFLGALNDFDRLSRQMERTFGRGTRNAGVFPQLNVTEDDTHYHIRAELPGIKGEELDLQITGKSLAISGERRADVEEGGRYHRREREAGRFSRVLGMPGEVDPERVEANLRNGILTVRVAKAKAAEPRRITIS